MQEFNRIFGEKAVAPINRFKEVMRMLLAPLQMNGSYFYLPEPTALIKKPVDDLLQKYNELYVQYMNRYPTRPNNIRFTQEELDSYFENTVSIVKNFVSKNWI